jgi:hypothetical protein
MSRILLVFQFGWNSIKIEIIGQSALFYENIKNCFELPKKKPLKIAALLGIKSFLCVFLLFLQY